MLEGADARVDPMRRALAVWGLTADGIGVLSIHGASTGVNEKNETQIWQNIFETVPRIHDNAIPVIA
jgi:fatty acid synthase subunit alpha